METIGKGYIMPIMLINESEVEELIGWHEYSQGQRG